MEKEEKIKNLSEKIFNALIEGGDSTYDDLACAIACLVYIVDDHSHRKFNTKSGSIAKYIYNLIDSVYNFKKKN